MGLFFLSHGGLPEAKLAGTMGSPVSPWHRAPSRGKVSRGDAGPLLRDTFRALGTPPPFSGSISPPLNYVTFKGRWKRIQHLQSAFPEPGHSCTFSYVAPTRPYKYEDPRVQVERLRHRVGRSFVPGLGTESSHSGIIERELFPRTVLPATGKHGHQAHRLPPCPALLLSGRWTETRKRGPCEGGQDSQGA